MAKKYQLGERIIRLEDIVKALVNSNDTLEALRKIVTPFADNRGWVYGEKGPAESWEWSEEHIFNESRLYSALGKDDARSVLGVWRRFREICELITLSKEQNGK